MIGSVNDIDEIFLQYARENNVARDHLPRLCTIDSAQGSEAYWVVFVTIVDSERELGFMKDDSRITVALTRPTDILHVITSMDLKSERIDNVAKGERAGHMLPWFVQEQMGAQRYCPVWFPPVEG